MSLKDRQDEFGVPATVYKVKCKSVVPRMLGRVSDHGIQGARRITQVDIVIMSQPSNNMQR